MSGSLLSRPPGDASELYRASAGAYHTGRTLNGLIGSVVLLSMGFAFPWAAGLFLAVPALVVTYFSYRQSRRTTIKASTALLVDTVFIAIIVAFARPPAAGMIAPIAVMALAGMLLLPWYRSLAVAAIGGLIAASGFLFASPLALPLNRTQAILLSLLITATFLPGFYLFLRRGNEVLSEREQINGQLQKRIRYQRALVTASQALLSSDGDVRSLDTALEILLDVLQVDAAVVARNVQDDSDGLCREVRRVVNHGDHSPVVLGLTRMPWSKAQGIARRLAAGKIYFYPRDATSDDEHQLFRDANIVSDMIIPIRVEGSWDGYLSFTDGTGTAQWDDVDLDVLPSIARMVGAYWSREDTQARLKGLIAAKDEFVASVSHELRTPLTAVVGFAEELRNQLDTGRSEDFRELVDLVADQSREVANIVEDLLVVTRLDSDSLALAPEDVCLAAEVERVLRSVGMDPEILDNTATDTMASVDPGRFRQIVRNLLTNAERYGGGEVRCEVASEGGLVTVAVIDDGPGIPEAMWEQVFEPYERAQTSTTNPASVGLGLTVSRRLARLMGGDLVYNYDGGLSRFTLTLPLAAARAAAAQASSMPVATSEPSSTAS